MFQKLNPALRAIIVLICMIAGGVLMAYIKGGKETQYWWIIIILVAIVTEVAHLCSGDELKKAINDRLGKAIVFMALAMLLLGSYFMRPDGIIADASTMLENIFYFISFQFWMIGMYLLTIASYKKSKY